ncbi:MAG: hypothetical protein GY839_08920, partial [candidate division Zixibacteria bacterium]|nr:hypothetical protein [candidate division Zixibacteria bacterium]
MYRTALTLLLLSLAFMTQPATALHVDYVGSTLWTEVRDVKTDGNYAYCNFRNGLMVLDISNPSIPSYHSQIYLGGNDRKFNFYNDYIFVANGDMGVEIIDKSDPGNLTSVGVINTEYEVMDVHVFGDYAYITTRWWEFGTSDLYDEVLIFNISNPMSPVYVASFKAWFDLPVKGIFVENDLAFITYGGTRTIEGYFISFGGVEVFDITNINNPSMITDYFTYDDNYQDIYVDGNFAYVAHRNDGLIVFDATYIPTIFVV